MDGVQLPAAKFAMLAHGRLDDAALIGAELHAGAAHGVGRVAGEAVTRLPHHAAVIAPPAIVAGQPRAVGRPREEQRHRAGAVGETGFVVHGGSICTDE